VSLVFGGRRSFGRRCVDAMGSSLASRPSLLWGAWWFDALRKSAGLSAVAPLGRRHASFAQTVLACSETGADVTSWSLTGTARQLSSQAAELARRGMPRPLFRDGRGDATPALVRSDRAVPSCAACGVAKAARSATIGGGCSPRRATQEERARSRVQRARPRGRNPRAREDERKRLRDRLARQRVEPGAARASARPEPEGAGGRA
jgi:hypothetical protein